MKQQNSPLEQSVIEVIIHGMVVRLIFSGQNNEDVPKLVGATLKYAYLKKSAG